MNEWRVGKIEIYYSKALHANLFLNVIYPVVLALTMVESEATGSGHRSLRQPHVLSFKKTH